MLLHFFTREKTLQIDISSPIFRLRKATLQNFSPIYLQTESGLYLLATFHNLSAPYTVECEGAYIEVERENDGFEARWCGNR